MDGQVSGLGTVHSLLTSNVLIAWILPLHLMFFSSHILFSKAFGDGAMDDGQAPDIAGGL